MIAQHWILILPAGCPFHSAVTGMNEASGQIVFIFVDCRVSRKVFHLAQLSPNPCNQINVDVWSPVGSTSTWPRMRALGNKRLFLHLILIFLLLCLFEMSKIEIDKRYIYLRHELHLPPQSIPISSPFCMLSLQVPEVNKDF